MKNYEKPIVLMNEEIAEGVYAASGDLVEGWDDKGECPEKGEGFHHIEIKDNCSNGNMQMVTVTVRPGCTINDVKWDGNCRDVVFSGNTITYVRDGQNGSGCGNLYIQGCNKENIQIDNVRVEGCR